MLKISPELSDDFKVDYENLSRKDAYVLFELGHYMFFERIDASKYNFDFIETFDIIEGHKFERRVLKKFDLNILRDYHLAEIVVETGDENLDLIDINKITPYYWLEVLRNKPNLLKYCNLELFKKKDIYYSIQLVKIFKDDNLFYLIEDRNYKKEISTFGWEELILTFPEWIDKCNVEKLDERSWKRILKKHPTLNPSSTF